MIKIGDRIRIDEMDGEPQYAGKEGLVEWIDDAGQIHGTWGGCAVIPTLDSYTVIERAENTGGDKYGKRYLHRNNKKAAGTD